MHFRQNHFLLLTQISLKFVPRGSIDDKFALTQEMACCGTGVKPLPEAIMTRFTDAQIRH